MSQINDLVGQQLGDYKLLSKLTSGGMAHIFIGEDVKLGRKAAIKVLLPDMASEDQLLAERFEREARAVAQLEHDNIIPIYQFGEKDGLYFIAMRFIDGNDLSDELRKYRERGQRMPIDRALDILEQIAAALDHAHKFGIVHRDVKPSNVLIGFNDKAMLSDFGLVLWQSVDKTLGTAFGTPRYISPEQATDSQSAVPQSDIYSLAVIVYEIVTGQVMFEGNTPMEIALSHITETPRLPRTLNPDVPVRAQNEIMRALNKDADKRHKTATDFIQALRKAYETLDRSATNPFPENKRLDTSTVPFVADDDDEDMIVHKAETSPESFESLLSRWDGIPADESSATITGPSVPERPKAPRKGLPLPLIGGGGIAIVIAVLFALGVFNQNGGGDVNNGTMGNQATTVSNPTEVPQSGATVGVLPDHITLTLRYNDDFFSIENPHPYAAANFSNFSMQGAA
ncbi:MAG: serine/threonine protein kinase, partial [Anaerolineae bacterium]|nr:serine/threonine protein kinase [Anaerolineae bacterium]